MFVCLPNRFIFLNVNLLKIFFFLNVAAKIDESDDEFVTNAWERRSKMDESNTRAVKGMQHI